MPVEPLVREHRSCSAYQFSRGIFSQRVTHPPSSLGTQALTGTNTDFFKGQFYLEGFKAVDMPSLSHPPLPQLGLLRTFRIGVKLGHARTWVWEKIVCGGCASLSPLDSYSGAHD